jgi:uncharacterized membrane protein YheB (UPF0754 family)
MTKDTTSPEAKKILEEFTKKRAIRSTRVARMESAVKNIDPESVLALNSELREFYTEHEDKRIIELLDRMTHIMTQLAQIINQVKAKRMSLEVGQKEIDEKLNEITDVIEAMKDWSATGL